nr:hypothetical protein Q903MT_gene1859 [Picea sitchensis]
MGWQGGQALFFRTFFLLLGFLPHPYKLGARQPPTWCLFQMDGWGGIFSRSLNALVRSRDDRPENMT